MFFKNLSSLMKFILYQRVIYLLSLFLEDRDAKIGVIKSVCEMAKKSTYFATHRSLLYPSPLKLRGCWQLSLRSITE